MGHAPTAAAAAAKGDRHVCKTKKGRGRRGAQRRWEARCSESTRWRAGGSGTCSDSSAGAAHRAHAVSAHQQRQQQAREHALRQQTDSTQRQRRQPAAAAAAAAAAARTHARGAARRVHAVRFAKQAQVSVRRRSLLILQPYGVAERGAEGRSRLHPPQGAAVGAARLGPPPRAVALQGCVHPSPARCGGPQLEALGRSRSRQSRLHSTQPQTQAGRQDMHAPRARRQRGAAGLRAAAAAAAASEADASEAAPAHRACATAVAALWKVRVAQRRPPSGTAARPTAACARQRCQHVHGQLRAAEGAREGGLQRRRRAAPGERPQARAARQQGQVSSSGTVQGSRAAAATRAHLNAARVGGVVAVVIPNVALCGRTRAAFSGVKALLHSRELAVVCRADYESAARQSRRVGRHCLQAALARMHGRSAHLPATGGPAAPAQRFCARRTRTCSCKRQGTRPLPNQSLGRGDSSARRAAHATGSAPGTRLRCAAPPSHTTRAAPVGTGRRVGRPLPC